MELGLSLVNRKVHRQHIVSDSAFKRLLQFESRNVDFDQIFPPLIHELYLVIRFKWCGYSALARNW